MVEANAEHLSVRRIIEPLSELEHTCIVLAKLVIKLSSKDIRNPFCHKLDHFTAYEHPPQREEADVVLSDGIFT